MSIRRWHVLRKYTHGGGSEIKLEEERKARPSKRLFYGPARFHDIRCNFSSQRPLTEPGENAPIRWTGEISSSSSFFFSSSFRERVLIISKFRRSEQRFDSLLFLFINRSGVWMANVRCMNKSLRGFEKEWQRDRLMVWSDRGARKLAPFAFYFLKGNGTTPRRRLWMSYRGKALKPTLNYLNEQKRQ